MVSGSVADTAIGAAQLKRYFSCDNGVSPMLVITGRMNLRVQFFMSMREVKPVCDAAYTMDGSEGAGTTYVPSPPDGFHQSAPQMPSRERLLDGPQAALSSWMPPHTPNGTVLEIATV